MSANSSFGVSLDPPARAAPRGSTSPDGVVPLLRTRLREVFGEGRIIRACTTRVLKERMDSRRVVAYQFTLDDCKTGQQSTVQLIGKRHSEKSDGKATKEFQAMLSLWEAGFGQDSRFQIPKPVHLFPEQRLILQERAPGFKLSSHLGRNSAVSLGHARRVGLWLAKLHSLKPVPPAVCSYEEDLASLKRFVAALSAAHTSLAPQLAELEAAIQRKWASFHGVLVALAHGDFHPENILVARENVTVVDFDRFGPADPAKDVGSFLAHARISAYFSQRALDLAIHEMGAFMEGYFSAVSLAKGAALEPRIASFVALSCLEALYYWQMLRGIEDADVLAIGRRCAQELGIWGWETSTMRGA